MSVVVAIAMANGARARARVRAVARASARPTRMRRDGDLEVLDDVARAYGTTRADVVDALLARCGVERCATATAKTIRWKTRRCE